MEAVAIQKKAANTPTAVFQETAQKTVRPVSWPVFQKKYLTREDGFKYEWLDGRVEQTERTMSQTQLFILRNLLAAFRDLLIAGKVEGELLPESDLFFLKNHRRPDIVWLTNRQIDLISVETSREVPLFVIEVISNTDAYRKVAEKMGDYRAAGVQVVWHIHPNLEEVYVFSGSDLRQMTVCKGTDFASAAPVLASFDLPVSQIFKKPQL